MSETVYQITPAPKPRQTRSDKWKQRPSVMRYRAYADEVRLKIKSMPTHGYHITFMLPMPKSWSGLKRQRMAGTRHTQRPDKDNLEKALLDALFEDDSCVWDGRVTKLWGYVGQIIIGECK